MSKVATRVNFILAAVFSGLSVYFFGVYQLRAFETAVAPYFLFLVLPLILILSVSSSFDRVHALCPAFLDLVSAFLAYIFCFYALGKLFGLQFLVPPEILEVRTADLEGFWKAWVFFGHSNAYNLFLAAIEFVVAILVVVRPTRTVGAISYVAVMTNIVAIDLLFGVETMVVPAFIFLSMAALIAVQDGERIIRFAFGYEVRAIPNSNASPAIFRIVLFAVLIASVSRDALFFYSIAAAR